MHRGEIYLVDLRNPVGSEQSGVRPAVIVQNEVGNAHSPTTIICPLTSQVKIWAQRMSHFLPMIAEYSKNPQFFANRCA